MNALVNPIGSTGVALVDQPLLYQHCRIEMPGKQVLGENAFRLEEFQGHENVSDLFEFQLELHGDSDTLGTSIAFSDLLGQPITVGIAGVQFPDKTLAHLAFLRALDGTGPTLGFSVFNGMVASFALDIPGVYHLTMRPAAWRMTLTNHYRIFRQMSIRDVLVELCKAHRVTASFDGLAGDDNIASTRVQDWLQAGETDYDFMRRLMGKAHVFYYFVHYPDRHEMVFSNQQGYPPARPGNEPLRYTYTDEEGLIQADVVSQYSYQQSLGISGVKGVFTLQDEAWDVDQPAHPVARYTNFRGASQRDVGELPFNQYKIVQYGFSDNEALHFAKSSNQAMQTANLQLSGASYCPFFRVGHRFRMVSNVPTKRDELDGVEFVLTQVQHTGKLDGLYQNQFSATLATGLLSAVTVQDTQQGVILARVTAHDGSDALKDWPYYVPDDFTLARQLQQDSQGVHKQLNAKGVYVRFSSDDDDAPPVWVKLASSMQTIPEVGCSVWVTRANDESELPEIQNTVQADGSSVVTDSGWTAHSSVGNSYSTNYGDSKSVRFGQTWSRADTDTAVELVENAYARALFRDASYSRGGGYSYSTSETQEQGMLSESWSYGSTYSNSWSKESKSFSATGRSYHESVTGRCDTTLASTESSDAEALAAVSASVSLTYGNTYSKNTSNGDTKSVATYNGNLENDSTHNGNVLSTTTISGTSTNTSTHQGKVSSTTTINADSDNSSTITGTSTNRSNHNIVHNFTVVAAQSSSSAIGANNSNDAIGVSNSNSATGASNRNSLTGVNIDLSLQGMGNTVSISGQSNSLSVSGQSNSVNVTGESNSVNVTGASTVIEVAGPGVHLSTKSPQANIDLKGPVMQIPVIILVM